MPKTNNTSTHICIYITPSLIRWIEIKKKIVDEKIQLSLKKFKIYPIENLALEQLIVCNPTYLHTILTEKTENNPVYIILQGPAIKEKIITHQKPHLTIEQLPYTTSTQLQWHMTYLYTFDHTYYYYICNLKQAIIMQYQILSIQMKWHLQSISPYKMELLNSYKYLFGAAYRTTQFAQDMQYNRNIIPYLFSHDDLNRILAIESHTISEQDYIPLLACCGVLIP